MLSLCSATSYCFLDLLKIPPKTIRLLSMNYLSSTMKVPVTQIREINSIFNMHLKSEIKFLKNGSIKNCHLTRTYNFNVRYISCWTTCKGKQHNVTFVHSGGYKCTGHEDPAHEKTAPASLHVLKLVCHLLHIILDV